MNRGSTRTKAEFEWQIVHDITMEASSFPYRVTGRITPIDDPGKESRVYRHPVGVIGVISPDPLKWAVMSLRWLRKARGSNG
jgi:aldehyde dehydrogenase (NAD+)